jgi:hypothetical protein
MVFHSNRIFLGGLTHGKLLYGDAKRIMYVHLRCAFGSPADLLVRSGTAIDSFMEEHAESKYLHDGMEVFRPNVP